MNMAQFIVLASGVGIVDAVICDACEAQVEGNDLFLALAKYGSKRLEKTIKVLDKLCAKHERLFPNSEELLRCEMTALITEIRTVIDEL